MAKKARKTKAKPRAKKADPPKKSKAKRKAAAKASPPRREVSMNAFAKLRGVSWQAVKKAVESGRLQRSVRKVGNQWSINPELAHREWAENTQPAQQREREPNRTRTEETLFGPEIVEEPGEPDDRRVDLRVAQLSKVEWQSKILELEYRRKARDLVEARESARETYGVGRAFRDLMLALPDRRAQAFAAETDARKIHRQMVSDYIDAFEKLEAQLRRLSGEERPTPKGAQDEETRPLPDL